MLLQIQLDMSGARRKFSRVPALLFWAQYELDDPTVFDIIMTHPALGPYLTVDLDILDEIAILAKILRSDGEP